MSEKLLRPRIRLVMLFYTFLLPLTFQSFSFSFFPSVSVTFLDYLWKMSGYWSHLKRVCVCVFCSVYVCFGQLVQLPRICSISHYAV